MSKRPDCYELNQHWCEFSFWQGIDRRAYPGNTGRLPKAGPPSATLCQHLSNIGRASHVCLVIIFDPTSPAGYQRSRLIKLKITTRGYVIENIRSQCLHIIYYALFAYYNYAHILQ